MESSSSVAEIINHNGAPFRLTCGVALKLSRKCIRIGFLRHTKTALRCDWLMN